MFPAKYPNKKYGKKQSKFPNIPKEFDFIPRKFCQILPKGAARQVENPIKEHKTKIIKIVIVSFLIVILFIIF